MPDFTTQIPAVRIRELNAADKNAADELDTGASQSDRIGNRLTQFRDQSYVVYWMTAFRRPFHNFALQLACDIAASLNKPLLVFEPLRIGYKWANHRMHRFVIEGMRDNQAAFQSRRVAYLPYVEEKQHAGSGLIDSIANDAVAVVTDDYPCFFHPAMLRFAARKLTAPLFAVDSNCLMPLDIPDRTFTVAHSYRRYMQKELPKHLDDFPTADPTGELPKKCLGSASASNKTNAPLALAEELFKGSKILKKWPPARVSQLLSGGIESLPIDQDVRPGAIEGGFENANSLLKQFVRGRLSNYGEQRNQPDAVGSSELSPHLHFGHISCHQIFASVMESQKWNPGKLQKPNGKVNGFWGVNEDAEAFLDQLCSWREIGFNMSRREPAYDKLSSLPDWTQKTIAEHADDAREYVYSLEEFEHAKTHDKIWNAAQRQLVREGRIHNYLRMLWGKKILHWTQCTQDALDIMVHLNNKYALDGRDPNSYSGIFWVLGRYDRAWGPERPIFGKIRYMTSENTAKKVKLKKYLERFAK